MQITSSFNPEYQNTNIDAKIVVALERISEAFRVLLWEISKKFNLTPIQVQILIFLKTHREEFCTISYLATEFNMSKPTISDSIKTLVQKRLITKKIQISDTRSFIIKLTPKGYRITQYAILFMQTVENAVKPLPQNAKENIFISLLKTITQLNKSGIVSIQRMCFSCSFYVKKFKNRSHYCKFLNKKLHDSELRLDCNEHQPIV